MKTTTLSLLFIFAFLNFFFSSCLTYRDVEIKGLRDFSVKQFSSNGFSVDIALQISNPNSFKIKLVHSDLDIFIKGNKAGKASIENKIVLKKRSDEIHHIIVSGDYDKVLKAIGSGLLNIVTGKAVPVRIKGKITAKAFMIRKSFPVDVKQQVKF